jgi:endonuclease/exonuclease/phosphatase family metal-dependent hydrolase
VLERGSIRPILPKWPKGVPGKPLYCRRCVRLVLTQSAVSYTPWPGRPTVLNSAPSQSNDNTTLNTDEFIGQRVPRTGLSRSSESATEKDSARAPTPVSDQDGTPSSAGSSTTLRSATLRAPSISGTIHSISSGFGSYVAFGSDSSETQSSETNDAPSEGGPPTDERVFLTKRGDTAVNVLDDHRVALQSLTKTLRGRSPETPLILRRVANWAWMRKRGGDIQEEMPMEMDVSTPNGLSSSARHAPQTPLQQTQSPDKGYAGDVGSAISSTELSSGNRAAGLSPRATPPNPATAENEPIRFCLFNTGKLTTGQVWEILKERLTDATLSGIVKVKALRQPNGNPRVDLWVEKRVAPEFPRAMYLRATQRRIGVKHDNRLPLYKLKDFWKPSLDTKNWRIDYYKPWRDRHPEKSTRETQPTRKPLTGVATLNVNGWQSRKLEVLTLLDQANLAVLAVQETLVSAKGGAINAPGYAVYDRPKLKGFRGHALLIHKSYPSYEVGKMEEKQFIHVKVSKLGGTKPWHVISLYLPSGGNYRDRRTQDLNKVLTEYKAIIDKEPAAKVIILGDWNIDRDSLERRIKTGKTGLRCLPTRGSALTFHRRGARWTAVDNIVISPSAKQHLRNAKVERHWGTSSDHFPLITGLRKPTQEELAEPPIRYSYNRDKIKGFGKEIVFSNRWSALQPGDAIFTPDQLNLCVKSFTETIHAQATNSGIRNRVLGQTYTYNRKLKKSLKRLEELRKRYKTAQMQNDPDSETLRRAYEATRGETRRAIKVKQKSMHKAEIDKVIGMYRAGETRRFHKWEAKHAVKGATRPGTTPVKAKNGTLLTEDFDIVNRTAEYYQELVQDDPDGLSQDTEFWKGKQTVRREAELESLNTKPAWSEVLMAIRSMALGTAPGHDGIPIEVYKSLLKEECHEWLKRSANITVVDGSYVALPENQLPPHPVTPMGNHLDRIVQGIWRLRQQPDDWATATNVSIYKSGDPTDLKNYRGISLIVVAMKIVTSMLATRLSTTLEDHNLLIKEQAGFRSSEEAVAQFISFAEVIRRRRMTGQKTYAVFIDFYKAFDKVMHAALAEKLEAIGVRGAYLELLENIYATSKARVRVDTKYSYTYPMKRGTRQGCGMSPGLFDVYINDVPLYIPQGVQVPGLEDPCAIFLFADDIVGPTDSIPGVHAFLDGITKWSREWQMPMGAPKCGVMLIGGTEEDKAALLLENFEVCGERVNVVDSYKYLGIVVTPNLGDQCQSDEYAHCKTLALRVKKATDMRRGFLRDRKIPLAIKLAVINTKIIPAGLYGGEWVGLCQRRTAVIQSAVNVALKLALQSSTKSNLHGVKVMAWELNVPTIEERMADMRVRLYHKAPTLKTWINLLVDPKNRFKSRNRVWSSQTASSLKAINEPMIADRMGWIWDVLREEGKARQYPDDLEKDSPLYLAKVKQDVKLKIITRAFAVDLNGSMPVQATDNYLDAGFAGSRKWIETAAIMPELSEGSVWLVRIRTGAWWTTKRRYDVLRRKGLDYSHLKQNTCPACGEEFEEGISEGEHIILDCPAWDGPRKKYLGRTLAFLYNEVFIENNGSLDVAFGRIECLVRLLGGSFKYGRPEGIGPNSNLDARTGALDLYSESWGGRPDLPNPGSGTYGFVPVAKFLALTMPSHKALLFPVGKGNTDPVAYKTTSEEETPMRPGNMCHVASFDSCVEDGDENLYRRKSDKRKESLEPSTQVKARKGRTANRQHAAALNLSSEESSGSEGGTDF